MTVSGFGLPSGIMPKYQYICVLCEDAFWHHEIAEGATLMCRQPGCGGACAEVVDSVAPVAPVSNRVQQAVERCAARRRSRSRLLAAADTPSTMHQRSHGVWIATLAATGIPVSAQDEYVAEVSENLQRALAHSIDRYDAPNEATLFHQFEIGRAHV